MRRTVPVLLAPAILLLAPTTGTAQAAHDLPNASATHEAVRHEAAPLLAGPEMVTPSAPASSAAALTPAVVGGASAAHHGPVATINAVALRHRTAPAPAPRIPRANTAQNRAMAIVGGVGLVVGAVIGGDAGTIVMLGSAAVGLYGLYRFLS